MTGSGRVRDPLAGTRLLLIDGSNQRQRTGPAEPPEEASLVGGLRALVPPPIRIAVVLDTDPPPGMSTVRTLAGVTIRHARGGGGDDLVVRLAQADPTRTLVVTDDGELRRRVIELGARVEGNEWLRRLRDRGRAWPHRSVVAVPRPYRGLKPLRSTTMGQTPAPAHAGAPAAAPRSSAATPDASHGDAKPGQRRLATLGSRHRRSSAGSGS